MMQAIGTVANICGVITPVNDIGEIIKAIADSVKKVKRNKYNISSLKMILNGHIQTLQKGIERCGNEIGTKEHIESLRNLQRTLNLLSIKITEFEQSHSNSSFWGMTLKQWWSASEVSDQLEQLETDLKQCRDLFIIDSINVLRQEVNMIRTVMVGDSDCHRSKYEIKCTMTKWKILLKADLSDPMAVDHAYLQKRIVILSAALKSKNGTLFVQLLYKNAKQLEIKPIEYRRYSVGNSTRDYEDASYLAVRLTRAIEDQDTQVSIVEWFNDFQRLTLLAYDIGLFAEARMMEKFQYQFWTLLTSEQGNNEDAQLACSLYNMAVNKLYWDRKAIPNLKRAVRIYRRLGEAFFSNLADSLRLLSWCRLSPSNKRITIATIQESIDLIHELATKDPVKYGYQMALCLSDKGLFSEYEKKIACYGEAAKWFKASSRLNNVTSYDYYEVQRRTADAYYSLGDSGKTIEHVREATSTRNRLVSDRPHRYISYDYNNLARSLCEMGRKADAINVLEETLTLYCSVVPSSEVQREFAKTLCERAQVQHSIGKFDDVLVSLSQVIDVYNHLQKEDTNKNKTNSIYFREFLRSLELRSLCLISLHRPFEALKVLETIIDKVQPLLIDKLDQWRQWWPCGILVDIVEQEIMLEKLDSKKDVGLLKKYKNTLSLVDDAILFWRRLHGDSYRNISRLFILRFGILLKRKDFDTLVLTMHNVIDLYHRIVERNGNLRRLPQLIGALLDQTDILEKRNDIVRALERFYDDFKYWLQYEIKHRSLISFTCFDTLESLVNGLTHQRKHSLALQTLNVLVDIGRSSVIGEPQRNEYLAKRLRRRSEYFFELGHFTEAVYDAEEAVEFSRRAVTENTDDFWRCSMILAKCLFEHSRSSLAMDDINSALKSVEEVIQLDAELEFTFFEIERSKLTELRAVILSRSGRALNVEDRADRKYFEDMFVLMT